MNRRTRAILGAVLTLIMLTVIPLGVPMVLPPELFRMISQTSFNLTALLIEISIMGMVMAAITLSKGFLSEASPAYLAVSISSNVVWLALAFVFLGIGSLEKLGIVEVSREIEQGSNTAIFDLRLFVYLAIIGTALKVAQSILKFREVRESAIPKG